MTRLHLPNFKVEKEAPAPTSLWQLFIPVKCDQRLQVGERTQSPKCLSERVKLQEGDQTGRECVSIFNYILDGNCGEKQMMLRDIKCSSYHKQTPEVDNSSPQCHCHSNNSGSVCCEGLCPRILLFGRKTWFVVPGTGLLEKTSNIIGWKPRDACKIL